MVEPLRIWVIDEESPGHTNQSLGLVDALSRLQPVEHTVLQVGFRARGWMRGILRWLCSYAPKMLKALGLEDKVLPKIPTNQLSPDLIISSGGKTAFASRLFALRLGVPNVYIGERKPYPSNWFHTVFTPSIREQDVNDVLIDCIPTRMTPEVAVSSAEQWSDRPGGRLWCMAIGGSSASHKYTAEDWLSLAETMQTLAREENIKWLITTSRRTGPEPEAILAQNIDASLIADAVWWGQAPRKIFAVYLGASERVFVTQDSVSMVSEAVDAGKATIAIQPARFGYPENSYMPEYLSRLEASGTILRMPIRGIMQKYRSGFGAVESSPETSSLLIAKKLLGRMNVPMLPN